MAFLTIPNVSIKGISACVPSKVEENKDISFYTPEEAQKVIESTGIERRHVVCDGITASDLCLKAGEKLIDELGWEKDSIDAIGYVTQMPDYINHPTGFVLHEKLGLNQECLVLDIFHGCPGWVVGLSAVTSMMSLGSLKRVIMFDGDISSAWNYAKDRESKPLFGDCGTAVALEYDENATPLYFHIGTKSADGWSLVRKQGGSKNPYTAESYANELKMRSGELEVDGNADTMDGMNVFAFGISTPPKSIKKLCEYANVNIDDINKLVIHQANLMMVEKIAKKLKVDKSKTPTSLKNFGNTTSASIPLTICSECRDEYSSGKVSSIACGFGVGLSWGTVYFQTDKIVCPEVVIY